MDVQIQETAYALFDQGISPNETFNRLTNMYRNKGRKKSIPFTKGNVYKMYAKWEKNGALLHLGEPIITNENIGVEQQSTSNLDTPVDIVTQLNTTFKEKDFSDETIQGLGELLKNTPVRYTIAAEQSKNINEYKRGDIVYVASEAFEEFNGVKGKSRPAIIIQNNTGNFFSKNVILTYLTTKNKKSDLPTHVLMSEDISLRAVPVQSMCMTEHIQTVDKSYINYVGRVSETDLDRIDKALLVSIGLEDYVEKQVNQIIKSQVTEETYIDQTKELDAANATIKDLQQQLKEALAAKAQLEEQVNTQCNSDELTNHTAGMKPTRLKITALEGEVSSYKIGSTTLTVCKGREQITLQHSEINSLAHELVDVANYI